MSRNNCPSPAPHLPLTCPTAHLSVFAVLGPHTDHGSSVHHLQDVGHVDELVQFYDLLHQLDVGHPVVREQHDVQPLLHVVLLQGEPSSVSGSQSTVEQWSHWSHVSHLDLAEENLQHLVHLLHGTPDLRGLWTEAVTHHVHVLVVNGCHVGLAGAEVEAERETLALKLTTEPSGPVLSQSVEAAVQEEPHIEHRWGLAPVVCDSHR